MVFLWAFLLADELHVKTLGEHRIASKLISVVKTTEMLLAIQFTCSESNLYSRMRSQKLKISSV